MIDMQVDTVKNKCVELPDMEYEDGADAIREVGKQK